MKSFDAIISTVNYDLLRQSFINKIFDLKILRLNQCRRYGLFDSKVLVIEIQNLLCFPTAEDPPNERFMSNISLYATFYNTLKSSKYGIP